LASLATRPASGRLRINNGIALRRHFILNGVRWKPKYEQVEDRHIVKVDCSEHLESIRCLSSGDMLRLEVLLVKAKLPVILECTQRKTVIYTQYVEEIVDFLRAEIRAKGWRVGTYTGLETAHDRRRVLAAFLAGPIDVLVASRPIGTGVDGLQTVCNHLIIAGLPWTAAEYEQLVGRFLRQGQKETSIHVTIPMSYATVNGQEWSWCQTRWDRVQFKQSIADAAVDGVIPDEHMRTPAQAYIDTMRWLERLETGEVKEIRRRKVHIPLELEEIKNRVARYGDFSKMNARINTSRSQTTHARLEKDPKEWEAYHALYREARKSWQVVPYQEIATWCRHRPHFVVGDFGCGEAPLAQALPENVVHSFDHVAVPSCPPCAIRPDPLPPQRWRCAGWPRRNCRTDRRFATGRCPLPGPWSGVERQVAVPHPGHIPGPGFAHLPEVPACRAIRPRPRTCLEAWCGGRNRELLRGTRRAETSTLGRR
jgi:hypothetical protein